MLRRHLLLAFALLPLALGAKPLDAGTPVRGWTILSASERDDRATIAAAPRYGINHLQLSHLVCRK
jgi:hypothetical protein